MDVKRTGEEIDIKVITLERKVKNRIYILIATSLGAVCIALFLALQLSPWLFAVDTRIELHIDMPSNTLINVCWDTAQKECLPLVPYTETKQGLPDPGEIASIWLGELPARPAYTISFDFPSGVKEAAVHELKISATPVILWGNIIGKGIAPTTVIMDHFKTQDVTDSVQGATHYIKSGPAGRIFITEEFKAGRSNISSQKTSIMIGALIFSVYLLFAIPLYLMPYAVQNQGTAIQKMNAHNYPGYVYIAGSAAIIFMMLLIANSAVILQEGDSLTYLLWAVQKQWITMARPPGYQMFVALALWVSNYHLNGVVLIQAIFLALSAAACTWILRKWLHPLVAVLFMIFVLFSPAQVYWARWILRDSLFAGITLLAVATAIAYYTAETKRMSRIWLTIFAIICAVAFLIRENGITLPIILLPALLAKSIKNLTSQKSAWERIQGAFLPFLRYMPAAFIVGALYIGLSFYNYIHYGYFQVTLHVTSHHLLWKEIGTATFDARSLLHPDPSMDEETRSYLGQQLYESFIITREKTPTYDPIYAALFPTLHQTMVDNGKPVDWFYSASLLDNIGRSSKNLTPWQADLAGALRQYRVLWTQNPLDTGGYPMLPDDVDHLSAKQPILARVPQKLIYTAKTPAVDSMIGKYYQFTRNYVWYRLFFYLALLFSVYILRYEDPVFLAPMAFYVTNDFLLVILRTVDTRYVMSVDVMLTLQIALGLSCLIQRFSPVLIQKVVRARIFNKLAENGR